MELNAAKQQEYMRRILIARMTVLSRNGFFGLLLMHMKFALDPSIGTAATDGERIYFDPQFLEELSDRELVFILMHEIMHVALRHTSRTGDRDNLLFNIACDIVVNSNILQAAGRDLSSITLSQSFLQENSLSSMISIFRHDFISSSLSFSVILPYAFLTFSHTESMRPFLLLSRILIVLSSGLSKGNT